MFEWVVNAHGTKIQKVNEYTITSLPTSLYLWSVLPLPQRQIVVFIYVYLQSMSICTYA